MGSSIRDFIDNAIAAPSSPPASGDGTVTIPEVTVVGDPANAGPDSLTKEEITAIMQTSTGLDDLKLKLGLGPVTDEALGAFLAKKGLSLPQQPAQPPPTGLPPNRPDSAGPDNRTNEQVEQEKKDLEERANDQKETLRFLTGQDKDDPHTHEEVEVEVVP